jgi:thiol-disulfide isomerase/thioredoxin
MQFNPKSIIMDGYTNYKSLNEVLQQFKGKRLYIDVWATWCGPCKAEFAHKVELLKLLQLKNIEIIYISIDQVEKDKQWKEMIKYYNLEGYHIRACEELVSDLRKIFGQNGSIAIPWYMLVDENGKIIKEHAKPPSQLTELAKEVVN